MMIRSKICGITNLEDALTCIKYGAHALGFVFYEKSKRNISSYTAVQILDQTPLFVSCVGVFCNTLKKDVRSVLKFTNSNYRLNKKLDILQFHGDEDANFCESFNLPYIKAIRVQNAAQVISEAELHPNASAILLDTYDPEQFGGTGQTFNWQEIPINLNKPIILAGGLNATNVQNIVNNVIPYAVDVSSGVEQKPGIKSKTKVKEFLATIAQLKN